MTAITNKIRFYDNDFSDNATISVGSSVSGFSYTNAALSRRSQVWKPGGTFIVTSSTLNIYINDGSDKTVALTAGTYTYSTLATHIQTQLNASSSGWSVSYSSSSTFKFTISRSSSGELRFSETSNAAWDMLGYTSGVDTNGTSWLADEQRNHTAERYVLDFGLPMSPTFFAAIGLIDEAFTVSNAATVKLKFNNVPDLWDSPALSITMTRTDYGVIEHLDSNTIEYRYACFEIVDRLNPLGPEGLKLGRIWIGDHVEISTSNIDIGFSKTNEDLSKPSESDSGVKYYRVRPKRRTIKSGEIKLLTASERREFEESFEVIGVDTSFFVSLDPMLEVSETIDEMTFYGNFTDPPELEHVIRDFYNIRFEIEEAA